MTAKNKDTLIIALAWIPTAILVLATLFVGGCGVDTSSTYSTLSGPWVRQTIYTEPGTNTGADGTDVTQLATGLGVISGWEQGGFVSLSIQTSPGLWQTVKLLDDHHHLGLEDAHWGDVDSDGLQDIIASCECSKVTVAFQPSNPVDLLAASAWVVVELPATTQVHWMQAALVTTFWGTSIVGGSRAGTAANPAVIAEWHLVGDPRLSSGWVYQEIQKSGWTMTLKPFNRGSGFTDVFITDRAKLAYVPPSGDIWELYGSRWLETTVMGWQSHTIQRPPQVKGDQMMGSFLGADPDIWDCYSSATRPAAIMHHVASSWAGPWTFSTMPVPTNFGYCQQVVPGDLNNDGLTDLVLSSWGAVDGIEGVVGLINTGSGYIRISISGPDGTKFDNVSLVDTTGDGFLDVVTSEQLATNSTNPDRLGVIVYPNPGTL